MLIVQKSRFMHPDFFVTQMIPIFDAIFLCINCTISAIGIPWDDILMLWLKLKKAAFGFEVFQFWRKKKKTRDVTKLVFLSNQDWKQYSSLKRLIKLHAWTVGLISDDLGIWKTTIESLKQTNNVMKNKKSRQK